MGTQTTQKLLHEDFFTRAVRPGHTQTAARFEIYQNIYIFNLSTYPTSKTNNCSDELLIFTLTFYILQDALKGKEDY